MVLDKIKPVDLLLGATEALLMDGEHAARELVVFASHEALVFLVVSIASVT